MSGMVIFPTFFAAVLLLSACDLGRAGGSFSVAFVWPDDGKPDFSVVSLYAWAKLQQWPGGRQSGAVSLSGVGPVRLGDESSQLALDNLTYGPDRVVVVEIRRSGSQDDTVAYFGVSAPFVLKEGAATPVGVAVGLLPAPGFVKPEAKIFFSGEQKDFVPSEMVTLRMKLLYGDTVIAANDTAFSAGLNRKALSDLTPLGGDDYEWPDWTLAEVTDGVEAQRSVFVKLSNSYGFFSESAQAGPVTVDKTPPETKIVEPGPPSVTNMSWFEFAFSCDESQCTYQCSLDYGEWDTCTPPKNYLRLPDGYHRFAVRAVDRAGNGDVTPAEYYWLVDTAFPVTVIDFGPDRQSEMESATIGFSVTDSGARCQHCTSTCKLDDEPPTPCASPHTLSGLSDGDHKFMVQSTDQAGNEEQMPPSYSWTVNTGPCNTRITSGPGILSTPENAKFEFETDKTSGGFECNFDGGGWQRCVSPMSFSGLNNGCHLFSVRCVDPGGNVDNTPECYEWWVDGVPPETTILLKPEPLVGSNTVCFQFGCNDESGRTCGGSEIGGCTFECSIDKSGWTPCSSPQEYENLTSGVHAFSVRSKDTAGNYDGSPEKFEWTVELCGSSPTGKGGEMCDVPAGVFEMGCNSAVDSECYQSTEDPYHSVTVPAFKIDQYEVMVSEYEVCVADSGCTAANTGSRCNYNVGGKENHPINCVDWNQAKAYCAWAGKKLPTEAEWEKAARGTDRRKYPWGSDALDCNRAVHSVSPCSNSGTAAVGSKPSGASPYGAMDMVGNMWEWVEDDWHSSYTNAPANGSAWVDAPRASYRVLRGGGWLNDNTQSLRASVRIDINPSFRNFNVGFRCSRDGS